MELADVGEVDLLEFFLFVSIDIIVGTMGSAMAIVLLVLVLDVEDLVDAIRGGDVALLGVV